MAQYHCQVIPVLEVPPSAFKPAPKVDSAIVRLLPYKDKPTKVKDVEQLQQVCKLAFNQRRKTIRNSLQSIISDEQFESAGVSPNLRAENLSLNDYAALANALNN
jgi:16S rRNA (adenine1518-N6/adenine1519-N6)-dimethyltransferase